MPRRNSSPPEAANPLAGAIRAQRARLGLSQQEAADLAQVSVNLIRQIEGGKATVRLDKLLQAMTAVGLQFDLTLGNGGIRPRIEP